jgi:methylated-DNA-[protein]-cysteine S-methyltransferase
MKNLKNSANKVIFSTRIGNFSLTWKGEEITSLSKTNEITTKVLLPVNIKKIIHRLINYFDGHPDQFSDIKVNLDHLTEFQKKVLLATRSIHYGQTASYQDIANLIHNPKSVRAVGGALGKNPIAIIVPCHRVIGKNKQLIGFSMLGGIKTKSEILNIERNLLC